MLDIVPNIIALQQEIDERRSLKKVYLLYILYFAYYKQSKNNVRHKRLILIVLRFIFRVRCLRDRFIKMTRYNLTVCLFLCVCVFVLVTMLLTTVVRRWRNARPRHGLRRWARGRCPVLAAPVNTTRVALVFSTVQRRAMLTVSSC